MSTEIAIKGVPAQDEDIFFFTSSITLFSRGTTECHGMTEAQDSPLLMKLFELPWVINTAVEGRALIVKKTKEISWKEAAPIIAQVIRSLFHKKIPFFNPQYKPIIKKKEKERIPYEINHKNVNTELGQAIQKTIEEVISPSLASHGGEATIVDLSEGKVYLYFGGGCQGCSQASTTVKEGIEKLLIKKFHELTAVIDVTDHSLGKNPYFK